MPSGRPISSTIRSMSSLFSRMHPLRHVGADLVGFVGAVDPDHARAAVEALEHVGEPGQPVGVGAVGAVGVGRLEQLLEVVDAAGGGTVGAAHADGFVEDDLLVAEHADAMLRDADLDPVRDGGDRHVVGVHPAGAAVRAHRQVHLDPLRVGHAVSLTRNTTGIVSTDVSTPDTIWRSGASASAVAYTSMLFSLACAISADGRLRRRRGGGRLGGGRGGAAWCRRTARAARPRTRPRAPTARTIASAASSGAAKRGRSRARRSIYWCPLAARDRPRRVEAVLRVEVLELPVGGLRVGDQHQHRHEQGADRQHAPAPGPGRPTRSDSHARRQRARSRCPVTPRMAMVPLARPRSEVGNSSGP